MENSVPRIESYVGRLMNEAETGGHKIAHEFAHVDRVRCWALQVAREEGFPDLEVVEAAALLHDIGLLCVSDRRAHAAAGADLATTFLRSEQLFPEEDIARIAEAIRSHSSLEGGGWLGAILRDADMLDLFGAVGLMRALTSKYALPAYPTETIKGNTWNLTAQQFTERFNHGEGPGAYIVDQINFQIGCFDNLSTERAKEIARPMVAYMKAFLVQLEAEILAGRTSGWSQQTRV